MVLEASITETGCYVIATLQSGKLLFAINDSHNHGVKSIAGTNDGQKIWWAIMTYNINNLTKWL